ncbi:MAG: hypothetical protein NT129_05180 [Candidatus Aenigmarchaeota archaeon]|nr:hypothetical protein [Candidatus Aenigmarchaeota archaeon]
MEVVGDPSLLISRVPVHVKEIRYAYVFVPSVNNPKEYQYRLFVEEGFNDPNPPVSLDSIFYSDQPEKVQEIHLFEITADKTMPEKILRPFK